MATMTLREQLYRQLDKLPDDVVAQIADFTLFVMARKQIAANYAEWSHGQWEYFGLEQLFREDDEVTYALDEAEEIYQP